MHLTATDLIEHGVDERGLDRDRGVTRSQLVEPLDRLDDRIGGGGPVQVVEVQEVAVDVRHPTLEEVAHARVRVLADRDEEVRAQVGPVDAARQVVSEPISFSRAGVVEEQLLELIEDHKEHRVARRRRGHDHLEQ